MKQNGKAICQYKNCEQDPMFWNTTSLYRHMERKHKIVFKILGPTIDNAILNQGVFMSGPPLNSVMQKKANRQLSIAIATSSAPFRFVDNQAFKDFCKLLSPGYELPCHKTISNNAKHEFESVKKYIKNVIDSKNSYSLCIDFWTGQDRLGYIGVLLTTIEDQAKSDYLLAVRYVPHPHTAQVVRDATDRILNEYGIDGVMDPRVFSISTDNGSNMVAGLSVMNVEHSPEQNINDSLDETSDEDLLNPDDETLNHFESLPYNKRFPCINHILNNNIKVAMPKAQGVFKLVKSVKSIISTLKNKGTVNDYIKQNKLPSLLLPPSTRWQYHYQMAKSFIDLKNHMPTLCHLGNIDNISLSETETLEKFVALLADYSEQISNLQMEQCKLSSVLPCLLIIFESLLESENSSDNRISEWASKLKEDFINRTKFVFDQSHPKFSIMYALAMYLDPTTIKYFAITSEKYSVLNLQILKLLVKSDLEMVTMASGIKEQILPKKTKFLKLDGLVNQETSQNEFQRYYK